MGIDRRTRTDRRKRDVGPLRGSAERRMHAERRLPSAEEATISADEFARYFGAVAGHQENADPAVEPAVEELDRNRSRH